MSYLLKKNNISILFENDNYLIVSKPSGLLCSPDRFDNTLTNLKDLLLKLKEEIYTVYHLDKETSGLICFAKNAIAHKHLNNEFAKDNVKNIYWAFVEGQLEIEEGRVDVPILNDLRSSGRMLVNVHGKEAVTFFSQIANYGTISLIEFFPQTRRTHQVRVHSQYLGCPLLVDSLYNGKKAFYLSEIKRSFKNGKYEEERPLVSRLTLHSKSIQFKDVNGDNIFVECDFPKDLSALYKQLEKRLK